MMNMLRRGLPISKISARGFRAGKPSQSVLEADSSKGLNRVYHSSAILIAVLTPVAFAVSPLEISALTLSLDTSLGLLFPLHSHVALNYVISDYVPKAFRTVARSSVLVASIVAAAGLLKLNLDGPGLTATITSLWKGEKKAAK